MTYCIHRAATYDGVNNVWRLTEFQAAGGRGTYHRSGFVDMASMMDDQYISFCSLWSSSKTGPSEDCTSYVPKKKKSF